MSGASLMHYWIERDRPERRMPLGSTGLGIVCAYCGIAYSGWIRGVCPKAPSSVQADLNTYIVARARGSHD